MLRPAYFKDLGATQIYGVVWGLIPECRAVLRRPNISALDACIYLVYYHITNVIR